MPQAILPLLRLRPEDVAERVLVVGDPARAARAAALLEDSAQVGSNREYVTYGGRFAGELITVTSHGIGSAGAGLAFEELARGGARILIRAGTCGALQDEIADGDAVIATGAVRDEGLTPRLVPAGFPALAHHEVIAALTDAAGGQGLPAHTGLVLTSDLFYPSEALGLDWKPWQACRVQVVEMEAAALFVIAALHGAKAGAILAVDGNPTRAAQDMSEYDPHRATVADAVDRILRAGLEALVAVRA